MEYHLTVGASFAAILKVKLIFEALSPPVLLDLRKKNYLELSAPQPSQTDVLAQHINLNMEITLILLTKLVENKSKTL